MLCSSCPVGNDRNDATRAASCPAPGPLLFLHRGQDALRPATALANARVRAAQIAPAANRLYFRFLPRNIASAAVPTPSLAATRTGRSALPGYGRSVLLRDRSYAQLRWDR